MMHKKMSWSYKTPNALFPNMLKFRFSTIISVRADHSISACVFFTVFVTVKTLHFWFWRKHWPKNQSGARSFKKAAPKLWKNLPDSIGHVCFQSWLETCLTDIIKPCDILQLKCRSYHPCDAGAVLFSIWQGWGWGRCFRSAISLVALHCASSKSWQRSFRGGCQMTWPYSGMGRAMRTHHGY